MRRAPDPASSSLTVEQIETAGTSTAYAVVDNTPGSPGIVIKTSDYGENWSVYAMPQGSGSLYFICALDASTAFAAGSSGTILRTTDGGASWERMYAPTGEHLKSIYAVDATHAWAAGEHCTVLRLVQANTRVGSGVSVDLGGGDTVTFSSVTAAGNTVKYPAEPPSGEEFDYHWPQRCVDISSSASFTGTAEVRLTYGDSGLDESAYRLFHNTGSGWEDVTTSVDTENNVITGQATSLSEFMIIYPFPKIKSVTPSWGMRESTVDADIHGYGFWEKPGEKPTVQLRYGSSIIEATDVVVHDLYHISCKFPLPAEAELDYREVYIRDPGPDAYEDTFWGFRIVENPPPDPTITSITPDYGPRGSTVAISDLAGTGFWDTPADKATVKLARSGQPDIVATGVSIYSNGTKITCSFPIPADAYSGPWDVTVTNPDGRSGTLPGGFMVTGALPPPTLTGVEPDSGVLGATIDVTLTGTGFWGRPS